MNSPVVKELPVTWKDDPVLRAGGNRKPRPVSSCEALLHAVSNLNRLDDFTCEPIGSGFFSEVFKVKHRTTGEVMVLKMNLLASNRSNMLREVELMKQLSHPNILKFMGACVHGGQLHALTEFMNGGSLEQLISSPGELAWNLRIKLALDIAEGLRYLHSKGFFHRDLTSKNVLLKRNDITGELTAVVGDLGLAAKIPDPRSLYRLPTVGSPYWMSPECLRGEWYDQRSDLFSYGIILCELIGRISADPDVMPRTHNFGVDYLVFSEMCPSCPPKFLELAFSCCQIDPSKRPSLDNIVGDLKVLLQSEAGIPKTSQSRIKLDDVYLVAGNSPSEKARCRYVASPGNPCPGTCDPRRRGSCIQAPDYTITAKHIGQAMSAEDPHYQPNNTAQNPFATLKRFKHGRKILDTGRRNVFSSCCELAWPIPASLLQEKNPTGLQALTRHPSRSLPSSPSSPRRAVEALPLLNPDRFTSQFAAQDDWALGEMRRPKTPPLVRRGSCESGFFSVSDAERSDISLSLDETASSHFGSSTISDIDDPYAFWSRSRRSPSTLTDSSGDLTAENVDNRDIRRLVNYFERVPAHNQQAKISSQLKPKPSKSGLKVCEGTVRSKVQLFDRSKSGVLMLPINQ